MPKSRGTTVGARGTTRAGGNVMLAVRAGYEKSRVLNAVRKALEAEATVVRVSAGMNDYYPESDLVVTLDGWDRLGLEETLRRVQGLLPHVATFAILARGEPAVASLLDAGFGDCVPWRRDPAELAARVRKCLRDARPNAREQGRFRPRRTAELREVSLNPELLTLTCGSVVAKLTPAEFRLLRRLLDSAGAWVDNQQLLAAISVGRRAGVTPVAVHVHAIRRKLEDAAECLQNDRRLGYRFETARALVSDPKNRA